MATLSSFLDTPAGPRIADETVISAGSVWPALVKSKGSVTVPLGKGEGYVLVFTPSTSGWRLSSDASWLSPSGIESGDGFVRLAYQVDANPSQDRKAEVRVARQGRTVKTLDIFQFGAFAVNCMKEMVLDPPTSTERGQEPPFSLLIMELGILGKFIAGEIRKAPAEAWLPAIAAVAAAVEGIAAAIVAARMGFVEAPAPPDHFSTSPAPMETLLIEKQAALLVAYISEQVLAGS